MEFGVQYVMTDGILEMLKLCADNYNIMGVSYNLIFKFSINNWHIFPASYPLSSHDSYDIPPPIHLDNVQCDGTESMLSECTHQGIGVHNCFEGVSEAGVVCTGMFISIPYYSKINILEA